MAAREIKTSVYCLECCNYCTHESCDDLVIPTIEEILSIPSEIGEKNPATNCWYGDDAFNSPAAGRFKRRKACLKFYYRFVNSDLSPEGAVLCQGAIGSTGVRDGLSAAEEVYGYREDKPNLLVGESCGLYIYRIDFFYWDSVCTKNPFWASQGGAQFDENGDCNSIEVYNVDMFTVRQLTWG